MQTKFSQIDLQKLKELFRSEFDSVLEWNETDYSAKTETLYNWKNQISPEKDFYYNFIYTYAHSLIQNTDIYLKKETYTQGGIKQAWFFTPDKLGVSQPLFWTHVQEAYQALKKRKDFYISYAPGSGAQVSALEILFFLNPTVEEFSRVMHYSENIGQVWQVTHEIPDNRPELMQAYFACCLEDIQHEIEDIGRCAVDIRRMNFSLSDTITLLKPLLVDKKEVLISLGELKTLTDQIFEHESDRLSFINSILPEKPALFIHDLGGTHYTKISRQFLELTGAIDPEQEFVYSSIFLIIQAMNEQCELFNLREIKLYEAHDNLLLENVFLDNSPENLTVVKETLEQMIMLNQNNQWTLTKEEDYTSMVSHLKKCVLELKLPERKVESHKRKI